MPPIFKALATITVWVLFVFGVLCLLGGFGRIIGTRSESLPLISAYFGYGIVSMALSVVCAKLRQMMG